MRKTVDTRPLFLLGRKRAPRVYKGLGTRLVAGILIYCAYFAETLQLQISEVQKFFYIKILSFCELRKKSLAVGSQITKLLYLQNKEVYLEHSLQGECFCATSLPFLQSPSLRLRRMTFTWTPRPGPAHIGNCLPGPSHVG